MLIEVLFIIVKNLDITKMSFSEWINQLWYIQTVEYDTVMKEMNYETMKRCGGNLKVNY